MSLEETLISVRRQALVDGVQKIKLNGRLFPVRRTPKRRLLQVDFNLDGGVCAASNRIRKPPPTGSNWRGKVTGSCSFFPKAGTLPTP
jgi:hypothetical protein